jgi:E3 ubiquitin-protein ligase HUWE1
MTRGITTQLNKFLEGFYQLIPRSLITFLDVNELELLIAGLPEIGLKFYLFYWMII